MKPNPKYQAYIDRLKKIADLGFAEAVLSWDQQTYLPKNGSQFRGQQMATLKTLAHEYFVDPKFGTLLKELAEEASLTEDQRINVKLTLKDYTRKQKYPQSFVEEQATVCAQAFGAWQEARGKNRFDTYRPFLEKIVDLKKRETQLVGYERHPYEALMEDYEPGLTVKKVDEVFAGIRSNLFPFFKELSKKPKPRHDFLTRQFPKDKQWAFSERSIGQIGYDFNAGRADFAPHPFCTTFGPGDTRITIRYNEHHFSQMFFAAVHEAGHALYEQGIPLAQEYGTPIGQAVSLAFHESQSRFWENNIARSQAYWKGNFGALKHEFPQNFADVTTDEFYRGINIVEPSFIRVEADELSYHAHIYIRYLVEKTLIEGQIKVEDLPAFWNDRYEEYLGIRPKTDAEGCLQDVHWSYGAFGYFPTYSLGSFYAAQLFAKMKSSFENLDKDIETGNFAPVLQWLRENVHKYGRKYNSSELLKRATGEELNVEHFMNYAKKKYGGVYGL
ncbi:MAG: carboxypeptidase M32 [Bdellovibrionales bacterium]|nr:carboxypeptidase M32 [Bdellovibrionales bacterium]